MYSLLHSILLREAFLPMRINETEGSTAFRNPRALGCSNPSVVRVLLRARGFLNAVDPVGRGV